MKRTLLFIVVSLGVALTLLANGCRARPSEREEGISDEVMSVSGETVEDLTVETQEATVVDAIPPSASPEMPAKPLVVKIGSNKDIQLALQKAGFYSGPIDGVVGAKTKKAVEDFQRSKGLKVDGKVGPKTWAQLEKYL